MKTSRYLILITLVLILIVPITRFYTVEPSINACMIEYVDSFGDNNGNGFIYRIDGVNHIEPKNSIFNKYIPEYKVGYSQGCIMMSGNLFTDFNNSVYCSTVYIIKKSVNHYIGGPELPLEQRFKVFKIHKEEFFSTAEKNTEEAEDILLRVFVMQYDDVLYSLKAIYKKIKEGKFIKKTESSFLSLNMIHNKKQNFFIKIYGERSQAKSIGEIVNK